MLSKTSAQRKKKKNLRIQVEQEWPFWRSIVYGAGISYGDMDLMDDLDLECYNIALDIKNEAERKAIKKAKDDARSKR